MYAQYLESLHCSRKREGQEEKKEALVLPAQEQEPGPVRLAAHAREEQERETGEELTCPPGLRLPGPGWWPLRR